ncbi:MAG: NlpC/P60 family N-terminal domain-containing protein, partial [Sulfurovum sp.]|nr:NlpC/P60 family N-terminal domain-containing protein [Sulfurovum sp.]
MMIRVFGMMLLCIGLLNADYLLKQSYRAKSMIDLMPQNKVADMKMIPQDPAHYADQIKPFLPQEQQKHDREFNQRYFYPWELNNLDIPEEDFGWEERFVTKKPIYTEKGEMIPHSIYGQWLENANMANVDTKKYKAITVRHTGVKTLPTSKSFYRDPRKVGEG